MSESQDDAIKRAVSHAFVQQFVNTPAMRDVMYERARQVGVEGWTPEHDDGHDIGEMALAAAAYAEHAARHDEGRAACRQPSTWPWSAKWWKPKDRRRDLVRAAALIVAEIERLDRAAVTAPEAGEARP